MPGLGKENGLPGARKKRLFLKGFERFYNLFFVLHGKPKDGQEYKQKDGLGEEAACIEQGAVAQVRIEMVEEEEQQYEYHAGEKIEIQQGFEDAGAGKPNPEEEKGKQGEEYVAQENKPKVCAMEWGKRFMQIAVTGEVGKKSIGKKDVLKTADEHKEEENGQGYKYFYGGFFHESVSWFF